MTSRKAHQRTMRLHYAIIVASEFELGIYSMNTTEAAQIVKAIWHHFPGCGAAMVVQIAVSMQPCAALQPTAIDERTNERTTEDDSARANECHKKILRAIFHTRGRGTPPLSGGWP